jgi:twitching motility protein PilT
MSDNGAQLDAWLGEVWERKGSDLLLTAGSPPLIRVDGQLVRLDAASLRPEDTDRILHGIMTAKQAAEFERRRELDFSFNWRDQARMRASAFQQRGSVAIALRIIRYELPTFDDLGLPAVLDKFVSQMQGLILVTGPTGSGKSTTLACLVDRINSTRPCHILTIEDPIEYVHRHKVAAVNQRQVGEDTDTFQTALRSALREDPDVLLIGEMRDLETIQTALTIAETGHLVLATLHTNDAAQVLDRIVDVFPSERQTQIRVQLANSLTAVCHQRLLPRVNGGRVAAFEVLVASYAVRNLIREGKTRQLRNLVTTGQQDGMQTLESSLSALVANGTVAYDDAIAYASYPNEITRPR